MSLNEIEKAQRKEMVEMDTRKENGCGDEEKVESIVIPRRDVHVAPPHIILCRKPQE